MSNMDIMIVSYWRDAEWCYYALRSIAKFAKGFGKVHLLIPQRDAATFAHYLSDTTLLPPISLTTVAEREGKGFLHHEALKCSADEVCSSDLILHMDSDCHFFKEATPDDYMLDGKPRLIRQPYEEIKETDRYFWKIVTDKALGFDCPYETMIAHPLVFNRRLYKAVRDHISKVHNRPFLDYVFDQRNSFPQTFAEFPTLGAYALKYQVEDYTVVTHSREGTHPAPKPNPLKTHWSHHGLTDEVRKGLEELLA